MPTSPVPLRVAAKVLNVDVSTLRRWIRAGACTVRPGEPGRGHGAMVNVADLQRWRATHGATAVLAEEWQQQVAEAFLAFHRAQRHRVVRRVDDLGVDLLGDERQPGLLPGEPRGPVRDGGRGGDDLGGGVELAEPLRVRALADDREVSAGVAESTYEAVDVTTDPAPVRGHRGPGRARAPA